MKKLITVICMAFMSFVANAQYFAIEWRDDCSGNVLENYWCGWHYTNPVIGTYWNYTQTIVNPPHTMPGFLYANGIRNGQNACGEPVVTGDHGEYIVEVSGEGCYQETDIAPWYNYVYVTVHNPNSTKFRINGQYASTNSSSPTLINWCAGSTPLDWTNESWLPANIQNYEVIIYNSANVAIQTVAGTGSAPSAINLLSSSYLGATPNPGIYGIKLRNNFMCGGWDEYMVYINLQVPSSVAVNGFNINGISQTTSSPANITICNGSNALNMTSSVSGYVSSYTIAVETGSLSGSTWTSIGSASQNYAATVVSTHDLNSVFSSLLSSYTGNIKVTLTLNGPCGSTHSMTQYFNIISGVSISGVSFKLEGKEQPNPAVPDTIWHCNNVPSLKMSTTYAGTVTSYYIKAEQGTFSGGTFTNNPLSPVGYQIAPIPGAPADTIKLDTLNTTLFNYVYPYNGVIRLSLVVNGPCGPLTTVSHMYYMKNASAAVDFLLLQQTCAISSTPPIPSGTQPRNYSLTFPSFTQPTNTIDAPCHIGWLGANSCAVSGCSVLVSNVTYQGYTVKVDEVSSTGAFIANVFTRNMATGTLPVSGAFNTYSSGYFKKNYNTIKNNKIFKVKVSVNTTGCGVVGDSSYFKIIDGGPDGEWYKLGPEEEEGAMHLSDAMTVYPNPANFDVNFQWFNKQDNNDKAVLQVMDITGRTVATKAFTEVKGGNKYTLDISSFPTGVYQYRLSIAGGLKNGKIVKE